MADEQNTTGGAAHDDFVVEHAEEAHEHETQGHDDVVIHHEAPAQHEAEPVADPHNRVSLDQPAAAEVQIPAPPLVEVPIDPDAQRREQQRRTEYAKRTKACKWLAIVTFIVVIGIGAWVYFHQNSEMIAIGITTGIILMLLGTILAYIAWGMKFTMRCEYCHGRSTVWVTDEFGTKHYQFCLRCNGKGWLS